MGMTNGILSIKHKRTPEDSKGAVQQKRQPAYRIFVKGKNYVPKQVRIFQNQITFLFLFYLSLPNSHFSLKGQFGILDLGPDSQVSLGFLYHWRHFSTYLFHEFARARLAHGNGPY